MIHNENSRVKIPALVHLTRLEYKYIKQKDCSGAYCPKTNIFKGILRDSINRLNGTALTEADVDSLVEELAIKLNADDLGRAFYKILLSGFNGLRLIDLEDESRNSYHVVISSMINNKSKSMSFFYKDEIIPCKMRIGESICIDEKVGTMYLYPICLLYTSGR